ncbi:MAG: L-alanine:N-amidino-3-keto-scyllo-inosamine aminotransferase [Candidatus Aminicenantes bacterium]|nr:L-alanine:N-amidino-3-keto-scyllo-inosamine aminotransferase [Candidatus Aminicenantes bacterium]
MPGPGSQWIGEEEVKEILDVMSSGHLFRYGSLEDPGFKHKVYSFEKEFAACCGLKYALATSSGTAALLCALKAVGIGEGDEVIVPAYAFIATYSAVIFAGGIPVLAEIDESLCLDPADIERRIGLKTKAIMPVHMLGNPCDLEAITAVADKLGLPVIEDACQANGASYKGRRLGGKGVMGAFSLNIFKTVTAGDGGVVVTDDEDLYRNAFGFHDQGHSPLRGGVEVGRRSVLGLNFRMNELTGAVALAQLRKLDRIIAVLREKKRQFKESITGIEGMKFRTLNDPGGECATLCTVIFDSPERAARVSRKLGTTTVNRSGWHVYSNMEHINRYLRDRGLPHGKGAYPRTDDILSRAINLSVGVVDAGLGAAFGINIDSSKEEIRETAARFREACR